MLSLQKLVFAIALLVALAAASSFTDATSQKSKVLESLIKNHHHHSSDNKAKRVKDVPEFYPACYAVTSIGYPCENHQIQTADGFILGAIRIPPKTSQSYPIVLQHGLIDSSSTWVFNANGYQNLATMLHDAGYDVILPNSRGNMYSRENVMYPEGSAEYFRRTDMDGMALHDLPAVINYTMNISGHKSLSWVGHSQGTWQAFGAFSTVNREYAKFVDVFVALAPVAKVDHSGSFLLKFIADFDAGDWLKWFGDKWFLPTDYFLDQASKICGDLGPICADLLMPIVGNFNPSNLNITRLPHALKTEPAGCSIQNMIHWQQELNDVEGGYAMHDWGATINKEMYGQPTAPRYNLSNMVAPKTVLFAGTNDDLADPTDVEWIISQLQSTGCLVDSEVINGYAHMDFVWGLDAHTRLYPKVLNWIAKFKKD